MKKDRQGVALEYSNGVPRVTAKARGALYERMIEIAREHDITIYHDPDLTEVLSHLKVGSEIPEDLYRAVAEVLSYCYRVNDGFKAKLNQQESI